MQSNTGGGGGYYPTTTTTTTTNTTLQQQQYEYQQQQQQNIECYGCIKAWYRTKKYLNIVSDKLSTFSMECSTRANKCGTWLCSRTNGGPQYHNPSEKFENSLSNNGPVTNSSASSPCGTGTPTKPSVVIQHGPGPSPVSSVSCDETEPPPKNCYRLVVLGSARVGKTSLVSRFLGGKFDDSYTPTIEDFHRKLYRIRGEVHQLDILDTSGNHPFPAMRRLSFLTGDIFVLVFSMDSRESFEEVIRLREHILEAKMSAIAASGNRAKKSFPRVPMVIAANKCDRDLKTVSIDEVAHYCASQGGAVVYVEVSAKKNLRVEDLFAELFSCANLPLEMAPNHHKKVNTTFGSPCTLPPHLTSNRAKKCTLSIKRRLSDACGVVAPNVRRPSIRTDLRIMQNKTCSTSDGEDGNASSLLKGCTIH